MWDGIRHHRRRSPVDLAVRVDMVGAVLGRPVVPVVIRVARRRVRMGRDRRSARSNGRRQLRLPDWRGRHWRGSDGRGHGPEDGSL